MNDSPKNTSGSPWWNLLKKLNVILSSQDYFSLFRLLVCVTVASILEVLGVFSILPFMQVISDPTYIESNQWLRWFRSTMEFSSDHQMMIWMGVGVLAIYAFTAVVNVLNNWMISRTVWGIAHHICTRYLRRCTRMPFEFFLESNSADLVKKVISDIHSLVSGVLMAGCHFVSSLFKTIFILGLLVYLNPRLALMAVVVFGGAYLVLHLARHRYLKQLGDKRLDAISMRIKSFTETIAGTRALRVGGATDLFVQRFEKASRDFSNIQPKFLLTNLIPKHVIEFVAFGGTIGVLLFVLVNGDSLLGIIPTLSVFSVATYKLLPALNSAFSAAADISHNLPVIDEIYEDMKNEFSLLPPTEQFHTAKPMPMVNQIALANVFYRYSDEAPLVLNGIELAIHKGTFNALVGSTGCGKSTLIDVVAGLLFPETGSLTIDGVAITRENVFSWQKLIAYVPQEIFLCDNTIAANIALGVPGDKIDHQQVRRAAEMAQAINFIEQDTPDGFDTIIGERGVRLSGGQRQRLGIARAFYKKPSVLLLDEATSALDNVTEEALMNVIENQLDDVTVIMIAHRLSTVKFCDTVYYLENGAVVDYGNFDQLTTSCESFRQMVKTGDQRA